MTPAPSTKAARRWRAPPLPTAQYCAAVATAKGDPCTQDDWGMALLISQGKPAKGAASGFVIHFEVEDVDARYLTLKGNRVKFMHAPKQTVWGYGPELRDPDGYTIRLFDHRSITK